MSSAPRYVPRRPIWTDSSGIYRANWRQQRLLAVTQGTLEMARSAMVHRNEEFANHLYSRAIAEIDQVIGAEKDVEEVAPVKAHVHHDDDY